MKNTRIVYEVVVAKTSQDNQDMNYELVHRSSLEQTASKIANHERKFHPDYAFIVLEQVKQIYESPRGWEEVERKVLEHY